MWEPIPFEELPENLRKRWDPDYILFQKRLVKVRHCESYSFRIRYTRDQDGSVLVECWKRHNTRLSTAFKTLAGVAVILTAVLCIILVILPGLIPLFIPVPAQNSSVVQENQTPAVTIASAGYIGLYQKGAVATDRIGKEGMAIANNDLAGNYLVVPVQADASLKGWHTNGTIRSFWLPYRMVEERYPVMWAGGIIDANHIPDRDWSLYRRDAPGNTVATAGITPFLTAVPTSTVPAAWMTTVPTFTYYQVTTTDLEQALYLATNEERRARGLEPLLWDPDLAAIAREHSQEMAVKQFLSHVNPAGEDPVARAIRHEYPISPVPLNGSAVRGIGENIAKIPLGTVRFHCPDETRTVMTNSDSVAAAIVDTWINHDSCQGNRYRDNLINPAYMCMGTGVAFDGQYYIATQVFT